MALETTAATRHLARHGVEFSTHRYPYQERGGAKHAAACLGVPEHVVVKTLVLRTDSGENLLVLMHGDRQVSSKQLARELGVRRVAACSPEQALRVTGYVVGGISPFGTLTELPVCVESSIFELPRVYINGGRRGLLVALEPAALKQALAVREVAVAR